MSGNFKVGEVLVGQNHIFEKHRNGMECTVIGSLKKCSGFFRGSGKVEFFDGYQVHWANGDVTNSKQKYLRRKQPPAGEASILNMFVVAPPQRQKETA